MIETNWVGKGERSALTILKEIFGTDNVEYKQQYPFRNLMSDDFKDTLSERQDKETLDIVIFRGSKDPIVIRVQDAHHNTTRMYDIDRVQRKMLEWNGCVVVDLWQHECPILWKELINDTSRKEVMIELKKEGIIG